MSADEPNDGADQSRRILIETVAPLSLDDALGIVGERTRAGIIVALGEARSTDPTVPNALSFSELMNRVGVEDSGRFNYHLDKLVGTFLQRDEDGYALRLPGQRIYEAIVAGTLTDRERIEPFEVGDCPDCGTALTAAYHPDHLFTVECLDCETLFDAMHFPARGLAGRSPREALDAAYQRRHRKVATMRRGVCHACGGIVERALETAASITYGSGSVEEMAGLDTYAVLECRECNSSLVGHPANVVPTAPVVVGFFADHGLDVALEQWWEGPLAGARDGIEVVESEPRSVAIPIAIEDDRLRVVVDDDLQVVESSRT